VELYEAWASRHHISRGEIERTRDNLRMAAMLHDVGKVAISDVILKKPGRFNPAEYETMKTHTWQGARLFVHKQSEFDDLAEIVALTHHENWDGSGYPGYVDIATGLPARTDEDGNPVGKRGEEIPIFGRIVAIADVYDALLSKRVYKDAWQEEDVLAELRRLAGSKFDPELIELFFEILPSIQTITAKYERRDDE
jgi:response regulator RpfG family c-di-GMP phosphodiesterase